MTTDKYGRIINPNLIIGLSETYRVDRLEKGEGSRGGKVIGHTKSGKPIYDTHTINNTKNKIRPEYESFSKEDHDDAQNAHNKILTDSYKKHGTDSRGKIKDYSINESHHRMSENFHMGRAMNDKLDQTAKKDDDKRKEVQSLSKKDTIKKSIFSEKFDELGNIFKALTGEYGEDYLEKGGKRATVGEVRTYGGKKYVKHTDGWVYVGGDGKGKVYNGKISDSNGKPAEKHHIDHHKEHVGRNEREIGKVTNNKEHSLEDSISTNSEGIHQFVSPVSGRVVNQSKPGESKEDFMGRIKSNTEKSEREIATKKQEDHSKDSISFAGMDFKLSLDERNDTLKFDNGKGSVYWAKPEESKQDFIKRAKESIEDDFKSLNKKEDSKSSEKYKPLEAYDKFTGKELETLIGSDSKKYWSYKDNSWSIVRKMPESFQNKIQHLIDKLEVRQLNKWSNPNSQLSSDLWGGLFVGEFEGDRYLIDTQGYEYARYAVKLNKHKEEKSIGKTKSGKFIYESLKSDHEKYKDFSSDDHKDAALLHARAADEHNDESEKLSWFPSEARDKAWEERRSMRDKSDELSESHRKSSGASNYEVYESHKYDGKPDLSHHKKSHEIK